MILTDHNRNQALEMVAKAPSGHILEVRPPKRSIDSNRFYWALLRDISDQQVHGKSFDTGIWHIYFKQLFLPDEVVELPDSSISVTQPSTTKLTQKQFSEYVDRVTLWAAEHGVVMSDETRNLSEQN